MQRRDLILGGAWSLAAAATTAGAAGQAIAATGKKTDAPGATRTQSFYGQMMQIIFETSTDLTQFMPPGLLPVDPHRAFIKAERLKIRSPEADKGPAPFAEYQQICITTMAAAPGFGPRHRNILIWEDRPWAIGSSMVAVKRYGAVAMTHIFEMDRTLVHNGQPVPFFLDVENSGYPLLHFTGVLDGRQRAESPLYSGFYVGGEPGADLVALTLDAAALSRPVYGTGSLSFGQAPNEQGVRAGANGSWPATLLKDIRTQGCVFQDIAFTRSYGGEFKTVRKALPS